MRCDAARAVGGERPLGWDGRASSSLRGGALARRLAVEPHLPRPPPPPPPLLQRTQTPRSAPTCFSRAWMFWRHVGPPAPPPPALAGDSPYPPLRRTRERDHHHRGRAGGQRRVSQARATRGIWSRARGDGGEVEGVAREIADRKRGRTRDGMKNGRVRVATNEAKVARADAGWFVRAATRERGGETAHPGPEGGGPPADWRLGGARPAMFEKVRRLGGRLARR